MRPDLSSILVSPGIPFVEALRVLDEAGGKVLFVVDEDDKLAGVLTDGDVRRHILAGQDLSGPVGRAMNTEPIWVKQGTSEEHVRARLESARVHCMPVLDETGRVVDAVWWADVFGAPGVPRRATNVPVAIMAGGKGTRLEPFTRILPKPLMPIGDHPVLRVIMDRLHEQGCKRFYISLNFKAGLIRAYFGDEVLPYDFTFFTEDRPLGTAGSLGLMVDSLDDTFILANCDTIVDIEYADLVDYHRASKNQITIVASMKHIVLPYGVCEVGAGGSLEALREKPRFDLLASTGIYVVEPEALKDISLEAPTDATDLISNAIAQGARVGVYPIPERAWLDVGQLEELQHALDRLGIR